MRCISSSSRVSLSTSQIWHEGWGYIWTINCLIIVVGRLLTKGPDSSFGGVHRGSCSDDVSMEEERVEVKVQAEEEKIGETHRREQGEEKERTDNHSSAWHMDGMTRTNTWANVVTHIITRARCEREKGDVWGVLFTLPVGCSRLLSAGKRNPPQQIEKLFSWAPPAFVQIPPWRTGRRRRMPPLVLLRRN